MSNGFSRKELMTMQFPKILTTGVLLSVCLFSLTPACYSNAIQETQTATTASDPQIDRHNAAMRAKLKEDIKNLASSPARFTEEQYAKAVNYVKAQAKAVG